MESGNSIGKIYEKVFTLLNKARSLSEHQFKWSKPNIVANPMLSDILVIMERLEVKWMCKLMFDYWAYCITQCHNIGCRNTLMKAVRPCGQSHYSTSSKMVCSPNYQKDVNDILEMFYSMFPYTIAELLNAETVLDRFKDGMYAPLINAIYYVVTAILHCKCGNWRWRLQINIWKGITHYDKRCIKGSFILHYFLFRRQRLRNSEKPS